jgi:hypothetical protein
MKCLVPECGSEAKVRGLCQKCYGKARVKVIKGKTTWKELIWLGLANETSFTQEYSPFEKIFRERKNVHGI